MKYSADSSSLSLVNLQFEVFPIEHKKEPELDFKVNLDVLEENVKHFPVLWNLTLVFSPFFSLGAQYEMYVSNIEMGSLDKETLLSETYYPVLAEFSTLISSLTKSVGAVPLVMSPNELSELADIDE